MIIVSLAFGWVHGEWRLGARNAMMSLVLCTLREYTGNIYGGIAIHSLVNAVAQAYLYGYI